MNKKYVYKNETGQKKVFDFYDKVLKGLQVDYKEYYLKTSYGETHLLVVGDNNKPPIFTLHGGNGINPLNLKLFMPLIDNFCIYAPDVIGMPGKSSPYRMNPKNDDYGLWLNEIIEELCLPSVAFVVSSYSSAMLLSLAKVHPEKISKAVLLVPSGIAHGPIIPIIKKQVLPFITYTINPTRERLKKAFEPMITEEDEIWYEFFNLILTAYRMELRSPREFKKSEMSRFNASLFIICAKQDIFFPPNKIFLRAKKIFNCSIVEKIIEGKHLPSQSTMRKVCDYIEVFLNK
jgi:pimeloyl-ACP methyl ester carboxylesterase